MKKKTLIAVCVVCASLIVSGCSKKQSESTVVKVGATPEPHAEMLKIIVDDMKKAGWELKIVEFTDYVTPNEALESGQIDANFFQHLPYMESFNSEKGYHMVSAGGIHIEPIALYSKRASSLSEISEGGSIAIPNDPTNEGRALLLLESAGLIVLDEDAGLEATPFDIKENPKNLKFTEIEAASLPRVLDDVDGAVINGNYAIPAGLIASKDGLYVEGSESPYVNIVTVKEGMENDKKITALIKALQSEEVSQWILNRYPNGEVIKVF